MLIRFQITPGSAKNCCKLKIIHWKNMFCQSPLFLFLFAFPMVLKEEGKRLMHSKPLAHQSSMESEETDKFGDICRCWKYKTMLPWLGWLAGAATLAAIFWISLKNRLELCGNNRTSWPRNGPVIYSRHKSLLDFSSREIWRVISVPATKASGGSGFQSENCSNSVRDLFLCHLWVSTSNDWLLHSGFFKACRLAIFWCNFKLVDSQGAIPPFVDLVLDTEISDMKPKAAIGNARDKQRDT